MQTAWLISHLALWVMIILLCAVVLSLMRAMGRMQQRLGPAPALMVTQSGPKIGDSLIDLLRDARIGENGALGFPKKRDTLMVFISPGCPACEILYPGLNRFRIDHSEVDVVLISSSDNKQHNRVLSQDGNLKSLPFLALPQLTPVLSIASTPYSIWVDSEGTVRAKGLTATLEHLESLWNARQLGVASINDYHRKFAHAAGGG
jgi:methylamine dehydrogenase accessory protein MauD